MVFLPFEPPVSSLETDSKLFIQEEGDCGETMELPIHEKRTRPPIELKPIPKGLKYAFINGDSESPIFNSNKHSDEETSKLVTILEKHRSIFGYSLVDLRGISPNLCTH